MLTILIMKLSQNFPKVKKLERFRKSENKTKPEVIRGHFEIFQQSKERKDVSRDLSFVHILKIDSKS